MTEIKIFQKWSIDQAIEETANKDTQSTPVTKGYNHKSGAVVRYSITADSFLALRDMASFYNTGNHHEDLRPILIERDKKDEGINPVGIYLPKFSNRNTSFYC